VTKRGIYILGSAHIQGNTAGPRLYVSGGPSFTTLPTGSTFGSYGVVILEYGAVDGVGTPFPKDYVIQGPAVASGPLTGAKATAIVLSDTGGRIIAELMPSGIAGQAAVAFRPGDLITDNNNQMTGGTNRTATLDLSSLIAHATQEHNVTGFSAVTANTQINAQLLNPLLSTPVGGTLAFNNYWDRGSKRAKNVAFVTSSQTGTAIAPWAFCSTSSGKATVVRVSTSGSNTVLELRNVQGTLSNGQTLSWTNIVTGTTGTGTLTGSMVTPTAGNLVPYCAAPGFFGVAAGWDVPPGGAGVDGEALVGCGIGITPTLMSLGFTRWFADLACYVSESASQFGTTQGGMAYGFLPIQSPRPTTWTLGEVVNKVDGGGVIVTGGGAANFMMIAVDDARGGVWIAYLNGSFTSGDHLKGSSSGVTADCFDNVNGYMKGAKWWNGSVGGADHTAFLASLGTSMSAELIVAIGWEGDLPLPAKSFVYGYTSDSNVLGSPPLPNTHQQVTSDLWAKWCDDIRAQLGNANAGIVWAVHDQRSQSASFPAVAIMLRNAAITLTTLRPKIKLAIADGYQLPSVDNAHPYAVSTLLSFQPLDYLDWGTRMWSAYLQSQATLPPSVFKSAGILVELGQSQLTTVGATWLQLEGDPLITKSPQNPIPGAFPTVNLLDNRVWSWNFNTHAWELANVISNLGGLLPTNVGSSGPELGMFGRILQRIGGCFVFKPAYPGTSSDWRAGGGVTFDVTPYQRIYTGFPGAPTAIAGTMALVGTTGVFTADSGTPFASFQVGWFTEISGGSALIGAGGGGNNTPTLQPVQILAISPTGNAITVQSLAPGNGFKPTHESLVFTQGPIALKPIIEQHWREAVSQLVDLLGYVPHPYAWVVDQVEANINFPSDYASRMLSLLAWMDNLFAPPLKGDKLTPLALMRLHDKSPFGTDAQRSTITDQQAQVVQQRGRAVLVTTGDLPIQQGDAWPPLPGTGTNSNAHFGVHRTPRGGIMQGERTDDALDSMLPPRDLTVY
jgi:hypothetical protein